MQQSNSPTTEHPLALAPTLGRAMAVAQPRPATFGDRVDVAQSGLAPHRRRLGRSSKHYSSGYSSHASRLQVWAPEGKRPAVPGIDTCDDSIFYRRTDAPYDDPPEPPSVTVRLTNPDPEPDEEEPDLHEGEQEEIEERNKFVADSRLWPTETDLDTFTAFQDIESGLFDPTSTSHPPSKKSRSKHTDNPVSAAEVPSKPRRLGRSVYDALETHGHFGLVDGGETSSAGVRKLILHVPKRNRGYVFDVRPGDVIYANSARGRPVGGRLEVAFVSRHRYVPPGHAVTTCVIGVPDHQWRRFRD